MTRFAAVLNLAALVALPCWSAAQAASAEGGDSPQAVVAAMQQAERAQDWGAAFTLLLPAARHEMAEPLLQAIAAMVALAEPSGPMHEHLSGAALDRKRQAFTEARAILTRAWAPHGLEPFVDRPALAPDTRRALTAALQNVRIPLLMRDTLAAFDRLAPLLEIPADKRPRVPPIGTVTGYVVKSDRATGRDGTTPVDFARVGGRWYLAPPPAR